MRSLQHFIPTGCGSLDSLLEGGLLIGKISLVYGEAETGKTALAIQSAVNSARMGCKTIFIDSDSMFFPRRLSQIAFYDFEEVSPLVVLVRPTTFQEQAFTIDQLDNYINKKIGLVVVDTITSLYRVELGSPEESFKLNRELNRQVACLAQIAKTNKVAILITSQVRSTFVDGEVGVEPVATRVLRFWSTVVIHLKQTGQARVIRALLEKHPEHKRSVSCYIKIEKNGVCEVSH